MIEKQCLSSYENGRGTCCVASAIFISHSPAFGKILKNPHPSYIISSESDAPWKMYNLSIQTPAFKK